MTPPRADPRRPRLLLVAYSCSPARGSEAGVGWNRAVQAARSCDTWVVCQDGPTGAEVRHYLQEHGPIPGLSFTFVPRDGLVGRLMRLPGLYYAGYRLWHWRAYQAARRLHEQVGFDLVHLATLCSYREPGYVARLGVPFVWGPWGGTSNFPWRFLSEAGLVGGAAEAIRSLANTVQLRLSPRIRRASRQAAALLANNSTVQQEFARAIGVRPALLPSNGITGVSAAQRRWRGGGGLRILWSGLLVPLKGLPLLLKAIARLPPGLDFEVRVLGAGPCRQSYLRLARRLGIEHLIQWLGWLPHQEALRHYGWADVFVFTSLRDTFPTVVLEALAAGLPVVCLDHQGMRDIVTPHCGIKLPVTTPRQVVVALRDALVSLSADPAGWEKRSSAAVERAQEFLWPRLGEQLQAVYRRVATPQTLTL